MLSTATHNILLDRIRYRLMSPHVESDISTSWFNQYFIKPLQGKKYLSLVDLSIVCLMRSFSPRCVSALIYGSHFVTSMSTHTNVMVVIDVLVVVYDKVGESGFLSLHGQLVLDIRP